MSEPAELPDDAIVIPIRREDRVAKSAPKKARPSTTTAKKKPAAKKPAAKKPAAKKPVAKKSAKKPAAKKPSAKTSSAKKSAKKSVARTSVAAPTAAEVAGRGKKSTLERPTPAETLRVLLPEAEMPVIGPVDELAETRGSVAAPRLARHVYTLSDGHQVGVSVSGKGIPLVVIHGFSAEGFLYAQSLSRIVSMGFKVIAIDMANHGSTQGLPASGQNFEQYADLLGRTLDELGVRKAFFAGHSMGGRLVTQLCASEPDRSLGVILIDAIVGDDWDRLVKVGRVFPPLMAGVVMFLAIDAIRVAPLTRDPEQAAKIGKLFLPTLGGHARRPWRLVGPAISILRSRGSKWMLQALAAQGIPVWTLHGTQDFAVPLSTAKSAARHAHGELVIIDGAHHCWPLSDPETLPAILAELLHGTLGEAYRDAVREVGLDPDTATVQDVNDAFIPLDAPIRSMTPPLEFAKISTTRRRPAYRYRIKPAQS